MDKSANLAIQDNFAQEQLVQLILEQQTRQSGDYILDSKNVPETDSQELLDFMHKVTEEGVK